MHGNRDIGQWYWRHLGMGVAILERESTMRLLCGLELGVAPVNASALCARRVDAAAARRASHAIDHKHGFAVSDMQLAEDDSEQHEEWRRSYRQMRYCRLSASRSPRSWGSTKAIPSGVASSTYGRTHTIVQ